MDFSADELRILYHAVSNDRESIYNGSKQTYYDTKLRKSHEEAMDKRTNLLNKITDELEKRNESIF